MSALILFGLFVLLLLGGIPAIVVLAIVSSVGLVLISDIPAVTLIQTAVFGMDKFVLLAIPLFVLTGELMNASGISKRLFDLAFALVGHFRGGLAQVNVVGNFLLGVPSGSSSADAALTSKILVPLMLSRGYSGGFSGAITASAAMLGPIVPPSIALILYGSIANASISRLFIAGVVPGILITAALCGTVALISIRRNYGGEGKRASGSLVWKALSDASWGLLLPVFILGAIWMGALTATEAGAAGVVYSAIVGTFVYRTLPLKRYPELLRAAAVDTGIIMLILAASATFSFMLTLLQVPQDLARAIGNYGNNAFLFLVVVNLALLFAGMLMEATALLLLMAPILVPIAAALQIDLIHFGIMMVLNIMIGTITPPFGQSVFIVSAIARIRAHEIFASVMLFLPGVLLVLLIVTFIPSSFMWLVRLAAP